MGLGDLCIMVGQDTTSLELMGRQGGGVTEGVRWLGGGVDNGPRGHDKV